MYEEYTPPCLAGDEHLAANIVVEALFGEGYNNTKVTSRAKEALQKAIPAYMGKIDNNKLELTIVPNGVIVKFIPGYFVYKHEDRWFVSGEADAMSVSDMYHLGCKYGFKEWAVIGTVD